MAADNERSMKTETPADRRDTAAIIRNIADRYEEGERIGAVLVVAMLPTGFMAVVGVTPGVQDKDLVSFLGIVNKAASHVVDAAEDHKEDEGGDDNPGGMFTSLRTVRGGDA